MHTILVTELEYRKGAEVFRSAEDFSCHPAPAGERELAAAVRAAATRFVIVGVEPYVKELYEALPEGGVIARFGVGHDGIDKVRAAGRGILCCNTPGVLDASVAEHAVLLMGCLARRIAAGHEAMRSGCWRPGLGFELRNRRLLVVGCGPIGRATARIAAFGFGMRVSGCDVAALDAEELRTNWGIDSLSREAVPALREADVVSLHIPSTPATRPYVDGAFLDAMKPGALLVNTARGALVDERALFDRLESGRLGGAALDVFEAEPYVPAAPGKDLRRLDRVLLTPHIASSTAEACRRVAQRCLENLRYARDHRTDRMDLLTAARA